MNPLDCLMPTTAAITRAVNTKGNMISTTEGVAGMDAFARFVDLLQTHSRFANQLAELEVAMNREAQAAAGSRAEDYVVLQEELGKLDIELKLLFNSHPEWRGEKKSVATPFGAVEQRSVTELEVPNPAVTVALIEGRYLNSAFLHITKEPNLEALEALSDDELAKLGINRVKKESITVKATKVSVAKVVKNARAKKPVDEAK